MITKDSGERVKFSTGAQRDTDNGKPRYENIPYKVLDKIQQRFGGAPLKIDDTHYPEYEAVTEDMRLDLVPDIAIQRLAALYGRGARKYDDNNWQKGIPLRRVFGSMLRHAFMWFYGDTSEDHLAAVIWNAVTLMWTERAIAYGELPEELNDRPVLYTRVYTTTGQIDINGFISEGLARQLVLDYVRHQHYEA